MGRTNPTFRDLLRAIEKRWQPYRRGLRRQEQVRFDQLFEDARAHADAAGYLNPDEPMFPIFMGILLEQHRRIAELEERTVRFREQGERLEDQIETLADTLEADLEAERRIAPDQVELPTRHSDGPQG